MSRKTIRLGDLTRGRVFYLDGRKFKVCANLGTAGVSVEWRLPEVKEIRGKRIPFRRRFEAVWAANVAVEIEVRQQQEKQCLTSNQT